MDEDNQIKIAGKVAKVLDKIRPRPDIIEVIEILHRVEKAFLEHLKDNFKEMDKTSNKTPKEKE